MAGEKYVQMWEDFNVYFLLQQFVKLLCFEVKTTPEHPLGLSWWMIDILMMILCSFSLTLCKPALKYKMCFSQVLSSPLLP